MRDFLLTVAVYNESAAGPIRYDSLRERMAALGLRDYLVNDSGEWVALPENVYAAWIQAEDSDAALREWHQRLGSAFGPGLARGAFFVAAGTDAAWQAQVFE